MSMEQPQRRTYHDDEISLVDLAKILIHRRWWFVTTFALVVLASVGWVVIQSENTAVQGDQYHYTTQLSVGYKTPSHLIEPLPSIVEQLNSAIIPKVKQQDDEFSSLSAQASYAEQSNIITIMTIESEQNTLVADFHEELTAPIVERHERLQQSLSNQRLPLFQDAQTSQLIPSEVVALAVATQQTKEAQRVNSTLILTLGILLGGFAGIFIAFFAEFVFRVRVSLTSDKEA